MKYFGTDGFRGEANVDLNVIHAYKVGRFLGNYFQKEDGARVRVAIGKDTRRSSYMFEDAISAGLTASGADVYLLHVIPTPSVSYVVRTEQFDCGIVISASHNPFYDNGIKIINGEGHKMEAEVEAEIEKYIDGEIPELPLATREEVGRTVDYTIGRNRYIGYLISMVKRSFENLTIALDAANGASYMVAKNVFDTLGAKTLMMGNDPNGTNINDGCGSTHIGALQKFVKETGADVGFAYDGDADRCLAVDDTGKVVDGDLILYVCGTYLKERDELANNVIVTTVMSNMGLYKALDAKGIAYEKTAVGDKYVYENMRENGHVLGGESSGHIIFSKYAVTGDGVLTSLMLMEVMMEKKAKLSELTRDVTIYPQLLRNVRVKDKKAAREDEAVVAAVKEVEDWLGDTGRILLRESGTEPLIRIMVEAETDERCEECVERVERVLVDNNAKGHEK